MREISYPVSKEVFDSVMAVEDWKRGSELEKHLPEWICWGYGFYGLIRMYEEDGKYFAQIRIGSTCD